MIGWAFRLNVSHSFMNNGTTLTCGCVIGYYWCAAHDIYTRQDRERDPRWTKPEAMVCERSGPPECCSCHISAPCSFCTRETDEANVQSEPRGSKLSNK
jgi:hypothetical protein